jgi:cell division protein FtsB
MARNVSRHTSFDVETSQPTPSSRLLLWLSIALLVLSVPLAVNIVGRIQAEARMRAEVERLTSEVTRDEKCLAQLDNAVAYARTDAFVEQWARERERLSKPGEVSVVPAAASGVQPAALWWEDFVDCRQ